MGELFKLKNGTVLLSTEAPGGVYNSAQLKKIADLCSKELAVVKATEDQRLALFVKESEVDRVIEQLRGIGLGIRNYQQGLHQPISCLGELCEEHEQPALTTAMDVTKELAAIVLQAPLKIGINGCARCCTPCHTLDISILGEPGGYRVSLGGKTSQFPELSSFFAEGVPPKELPRLLKKVVALFQKQAEPGETLHSVLDRCGVEEYIKALSPYSQDAAQRDDPFASSESDGLDAPATSDSIDDELGEIPSDDQLSDLDDGPAATASAADDEIGLSESEAEDSSLGIDDGDLALEADSGEDGLAFDESMDDLPAAPQPQGKAEIEAGDDLALEAEGVDLASVGGDDELSLDSGEGELSLDSSDDDLSLAPADEGISLESSDDDLSMEAGDDALATDVSEDTLSLDDVESLEAIEAAPEEILDADDASALEDDIGAGEDELSVAGEDSLELEDEAPAAAVQVAQESDADDLELVEVDSDSDLTLMEDTPGEDSLEEEFEAAPAPQAPAPAQNLGKATAVLPDEPMIEDFSGEIEFEDEPQLTPPDAKQQQKTATPEPSLDVDDADLGGENLEIEADLSLEEDEAPALSVSPGSKAASAPPMDQDLDDEIPIDDTEGQTLGDDLALEEDETHLPEPSANVQGQASKAPSPAPAVQTLDDEDQFDLESDDSALLDEGLSDDDDLGVAATAPVSAPPTAPSSREEATSDDDESLELMEDETSELGIDEEVSLDELTEETDLSSAPNEELDSIESGELGIEELDQDEIPELDKELAPEELQKNQKTAGKSAAAASIPEDSFDEEVNDTSMTLSDEEESDFEAKLEASIDEESRLLADEDDDLNQDAREETLSFLESDPAPAASRPQPALSPAVSQAAPKKVSAAPVTAFPKKRDVKPAEAPGQEFRLAGLSFEGQTMRLMFAAGAFMEIDLSQLGSQEERVFTVGGKELIVTQADDGYFLTTDGLRIFYPHLPLSA